MRVRTICSVLAFCAIIGVVPAVQALVVNEIYYDGPGTDAGMFTEILGEPGFVLDGYSLVGVNGSDGLDYRTILLDGMLIPADGRLVIGQDTTVPDYDYINTGVDWQNGPDQVQIRFGATVVDGICYGEAALLNCEGGTWGPDVAAGHSISRCPDGRDTDNNQADTAETLPTPGVTNDCPSLPVDMPLCEVVALDADGFPIHFGELVHITDPLLILNDDGTFTVGSLDAAATGGGCCVNLFDFNVRKFFFRSSTGHLLSAAAAEHVYKAGESWTEVPGDHHKVSANASSTKPARLLAIFVVDTTEQEIVIPNK